MIWKLTEGHYHEAEDDADNIEFRYNVWGVQVKDDEGNYLPVGCLNIIWHKGKDELVDAAGVLHPQLVAGPKFRAQFEALASHADAFYHVLRDEYPEGKYYFISTSYGEDGEVQVGGVENDLPTSAHNTQSEQHPHNHHEEHDHEA